MQAQFEDFEDQTGLRFPWNMFPANEAEQKRCVIPLSCLYQPLRPRTSPVLVQIPPTGCRKCRAILNPYCRINSATGLWGCPFCGTQNQLPALPPLEKMDPDGTIEPQVAQTQAQGETQLPFPVDPAALDIEYVVAPPETQKPPIFFYVLDTCFEEKADFESLKQTVQESIHSLPPDALVGFLTFGRHVQVYEVGVEERQTLYSFNGSKTYTAEQVSKRLGLTGALAGINNGALTSASRFVQQHAVCEFGLDRFMETLEQDMFAVGKQERQHRATGCAVSVAESILQTTYPRTGARILVFTAGPCTEGPGQVVGIPYSEPIRSHHDIINVASVAKRYRESSEFYTGVAKTASANGHTIDVLIGCYDQVGLSEMESLAHQTGGIVVQSDSFTSAIFKRSFKRLLLQDEATGALGFGLNATLQVKVSHNLRIRGAIGHMTSLHHSDNDTELVSASKRSTLRLFRSTGDSSAIGESGTDAWKLGAVWTHSTYVFFFDVASGPGIQLANGRESVPGAAIQFITTYQHPDGSRRIHVTTVERPISATGSGELVQNFDQEAAAVIVAREAVWRGVQSTEWEPNDGVRLIDNFLIDLCSHFASYRANDPGSLSLPAEINLFPQFVYHLRRSGFVQVFNSSPDETSYYRHCFLAEDCTNSLIMIQPTLTAYQLDKEPEPVVLDSTSLKPERILLLDTFFHLLIYHGSVVAEWRRLGYQEQPDYKYFKDFLEQPRLDAADILVDRFPLPRFIDTEEGGSQARFLMSRLSPTTSYRNVDSMMNLATRGAGAGDGESGAVILTDDVSLLTFMEYVKKAVVRPE